MNDKLEKILKFLVGNVGCSVWWCRKEVVGHIEIKVDETDIKATIPYCEKHGEIAKEYVKQRYPNGKIEI